jgi:hypothetical protein
VRLRNRIARGRIFSQTDIKLYFVKYENNYINIICHTIILLILGKSIIWPKISILFRIQLKCQRTVKLWINRENVTSLREDCVDKRRLSTLAHKEKKQHFVVDLSIAILFFVFRALKLGHHVIDWIKSAWIVNIYVALMMVGWVCTGIKMKGQN